jgi:hypothetical protein
MYVLLLKASAIIWFTASSLPLPVAAAGSPGYHHEGVGPGVADAEAEGDEEGTIEGVADGGALG